MRLSGKRFLALLLIIAAFTVSGCGGEKVMPAGALPNDILTFKDNAANRPIIRVGTQFYSPEEPLVDLLQEKYPAYLFVLDSGASAGAFSESRLVESLKNGTKYYDLVITNSLAGYTDDMPDVFTDLSAEPFLDDYLLSALNNVSVGGRIYMIPGNSSLSGIAYNADMFREHGWAVPQTVEAFFALCGEISAAGIRPFSACFKYDGALSRLLTMMNYAGLFRTREGNRWLNDVQAGDARFEGFFEPVYEIAKRLADSGALDIGTFTASLTKQRQAFWAGEYAMIDYDSVIYTYAEAEGAPFEIGMMPYPSRKAGDAGFAVTPEYYFSVPKAVEKDPERLALMKDILAFISSAEGQKAMLANSMRISNVKGVEMPDNESSRYAREAYQKGNLYPIVAYRAAADIPFTVIQQAAVKMLFEGKSVDEAIAYTDEETARARASQDAAKQTYEKIAEAEKRFTVLETSCYIAKTLRRLAGSDIGLMINGGFFRSNLANIDEGAITSDMRRFVMKGVGAEDFLTTYKMTGAQIKSLLEHPIVNGAEIDAFVAPSGLKIRYAPWNARGKRVLDVTREDGSALKDETLYTVAAWAGAVDEKYITETVAAHETLGKLEDILSAALKEDGKIAPDMNCVTLVWPEAQ